MTSYSVFLSPWLETISPSLFIHLFIHTHCCLSVPTPQLPSHSHSLTHTHSPGADRCGARQHKAMLSWPIERYCQAPLGGHADHWPLNKWTHTHTHMHSRAFPLGPTPTHSASHGSHPSGPEGRPGGSLLLISLIRPSFQLHQCQWGRQILILDGPTCDKVNSLPTTIRPHNRWAKHHHFRSSVPIRKQDFDARVNQ